MQRLSAYQEFSAEFLYSCPALQNPAGLLNTEVVGMGLGGGRE